MIKSRGERLQLPSGRTVRLRKTSDPLRRWEAQRVDVAYVVRRQRKGNTAEWEIYSTQGVHAPLHLEGQDAQALAAALNALPAA